MRHTQAETSPLDGGYLDDEEVGVDVDDGEGWAGRLMCLSWMVGTFSNSGKTRFFKNEKDGTSGSSALNPPLRRAACVRCQSAGSVSTSEAAAEDIGALFAS